MSHAYRSSCLLVCLVGVALPSLQAQVSVEWKRFHDDSGDTTVERPQAIVVDGAGNVYVAGAVCDAGGPAGIYDPLLIKYDAGGQLQWSRRDATVAVNEKAWALALDGTGGVVVVASSFFGETSDVRLLRYDASGALSWASQPYDFAGGDDVVEGHECLIDAQGNIFVAATSRGVTLDGVLLSYDSAGALRWATRIDGAGSPHDGLAALCFDGQGGVIVGGWTSDEFAHLIARVDAQGGISWITAFPVGTNQLHKIYALACDGQGKVYAAGMGPAAAGTGPNAAWLHQLDVSSGQIQWTRYRGSATWFDMKVLGGGVVACGKRYELPSDTSRNMLTERFASDGSSVWQQAWNSSYNYSEIAMRVLVDAGGDVLVAGYSSPTGGYFWPQRLVCLRYSPEGALRWPYEVVEPEAATCYFGSAALAPDGAVLLTGMKVKMLVDPVPPPDIETVKLRAQSVVFCAGDASSASCPCGNDGREPSQRGCLNSTGSGARLIEGGNASLAADILLLTSSGELPNSLSIFLQGDLFQAPVPFGDGLRCVGGNLKRMYARNANQGTISAPISGELSISLRSSALGDPLTPGAQRGYQVYYRDSDPLFCPAPQGSTFNVSNGLRVTWGG